MSVLPAVLDALVGLFTAAVDVPVVDGPPVQALTERQFVLVGAVEPGEQDDTATTVVDWTDLGTAEWPEESGDIMCAAWSWGGDGSLADHRAAAYQLMGACSQALYADPTLGGAIEATAMPTRVVATAYRPAQTSNGPVARVVFTVHYSTTS